MTMMFEHDVENSLPSPSRTFLTALHPASSSSPRAPLSLPYPLVSTTAATTNTTTASLLRSDYVHMPPLPYGGEDSLEEDIQEYAITLLRCLAEMHRWVDVQFERIQRMAMVVSTNANDDNNNNNNNSNRNTNATNTNDIEDGQHEEDQLLVEALDYMEIYLSDCAAGPAWWKRVWRTGTIFQHDLAQERGLPTSLMTHVFWVCLRLRLAVRAQAIKRGRASPPTEDEKPQDFKWLLSQKICLSKPKCIGRLSLANMDQCLYTLLLHWQTCRFHEELVHYVQRLLDRMAVLLLFSHPAHVLDNVTFCERDIPASSPRQTPWAPPSNETATTAAVKKNHEVDHQRHFNTRDTHELYRANFDCIMLCQLRYWKLTRALHLHYLFPHSTSPPPRPLRLVSGPDQLNHGDEDDGGAHEWCCPSALTLRTHLLRRGAKLQSTFCEQLRNYFTEHIIAPDNRAWVNYVSPTTSATADAIIEKCHDKVGQIMIEETQIPVSTWLASKKDIRIAFVEYTVLQVFDKWLPPMACFFDKFVVLNEEIEGRLEGIVKSRRPRFVQFFGRFNLFHQGQVLDTNSIYDSLELWIRLMARGHRHSHLWRDCLQPFLCNVLRLPIQPPSNHD